MNDVAAIIHGQARGARLAGKARLRGARLTRLARPVFLASLARLVMHMRKPFILMLLCQRSQIAVDLVSVAAGGSHLNRQMFDAEICTDFCADGVKEIIGQG